MEDGKIKMNKVTRKNLAVRLGDEIVVKAAEKVDNLTKIHILPFEDSLEGITYDPASIA